MSENAEVVDMLFQSAKILKNMARQTKMILRIFLVVVVIVGFWYGVSRKSPSVSVEEPIKIGAILMLSGKTASYGERAHRGFVLALEDIAQSVPALEIEILYEDSGYDPKKGLSAYQKLRDINDVSVVITMSSSVSLAISSLVNQDKVLQMAIAASTPDYTSEGDFTFRTTARAEVEDKELAKAVASHYSKIALLYTNDERGIGHRDAITVAIEKLGGEIIIEETMLPEDNDFRTQLIKIKGQNPEAIYLLTDAKSGGMILKQA